MHLTAYVRRPVRRLPLERARRVERGRTKKLHTDVVFWEVVAHRQAGLLEAQRPVGLGQQFAVESNFDVDIAGTDGDGMARTHDMVNDNDTGTIPATAS